ncbi:MAG: class I SAM-dependent methyltransferase [Patescibacteria group bacterium]
MKIYNFKEYFRTLTPNYLLFLIKKNLPENCLTLLDLGCGDGSQVQFLPRTIKCTGVEAHAPSLKISKNNNIHNNYVAIDVRNIQSVFKPKSFDCVLAIDLIEHLTKREALVLLQQMEIIASKIIMLQTPSGFLTQHEYKGNQLQKHKCGFTHTELQSLGYTVYGMHGPKFLRINKDGTIRILNVPLALIANVLDLFMRKLPKYCFNMFAYKKIQGKNAD